MAASLNFGTFNSSEEDFKSYSERMEQYFVVANITQEKDRVATMISMMGSRSYAKLKDLCAPTSPKELKYDEICKKMTDYYSPEKPTLANRFKFYRRKQLENETITDFLINLMRLAEKCNFGDFRDTAIRDALVCGVRDLTIQTKLLGKSDAELTLEKAKTTALAMETASRNTSEIRAVTRQPNSNVNFVDNRRQIGRDKQLMCYCCGKQNHMKKDCRYKNFKCEVCEMTGHLKRMCRADFRGGKNRNKTSSYKTSKPRKGRNKYEKRSSKVKRMNDSECSGSDSERECESESDSSDNQYNYVHYAYVKIGKCDSKSRSTDPIVTKLKVQGVDLKMEVDTGCGKSLISYKEYKDKFHNLPLKRSNIKLKTLTGENVQVHGAITVQVNTSEGKKNLQLCVVGEKDTEYPSLLGRDWLNEVKLDWRSIFAEHQVNVNKTSECVKGLDKMLDKYNVFDGKQGCVKGVQVKLEVEENSQQKFFKPRPLPFALKDKVADEIHRMVENKVLEKVDYSDYATPIVPVRKPSGDVRICGDYKMTVNQILKVKEHPLPTPEELLLKLNGGQKFSKLDLTNAYQQVELDNESRKYVCINTHLGLFRYTRLPFGVSSSTAIFQELMEKILAGIEGVALYVDDIIVTGVNDVDHMRNLESVLKRLSEWNLKVKKSKCTFMQDSVEYLGFKVDKVGIHPTDTKIEAILKAPRPQNVHELHSLCGGISYYRKFIPNLSSIMHPLNKLKGNVDFKWSKECDEAFTKVKQLLSSANVLVHYDPNKDLTMAVDASPYGVSAVISHHCEDTNTERPIAYASRSLTQAERNYSQLEREALAIVFGLQRFHQYLYARKFTLWTDNKPLSLILGSKKGLPILAASRIQRWAVILSGYTYVIKHRPAERNCHADFLSRLPIPDSDLSTKSEREKFNTFWTNEATETNKSQINNMPISKRMLRKATETDKVLSKVMHFVQYGWPEEELHHEFKQYAQKKHELTIEEGCLMWGLRVVIPQKLQENVLSELHQQHPGIVKMKSLARMHVYWPNIDQAIEQKVRQCPDCNQLTDPIKANQNNWIWPNKPGVRIHIDYAGPLDGMMYLIVIDAHSKWAEVIAMKKTTSEATIKAIRKIFADWGIPEQLVSDNGPQFISEEFESFLKKNGVQHIRSAPRHPASNGEAEAFVKVFKSAMKPMRNESGEIHQKLARFLLSYRTTPHTTTHETPAKLFMGRELRTRLTALKPDLANSIKKRTSSLNNKFRTIEVGSNVLVRDYRIHSNRYSQGIILHQLGPVTYQVRVGDQLWKRHIDQLKAFQSFEQNQTKSGGQIKHKFR